MLGAWVKSGESAGWSLSRRAGPDGFLAGVGGWVCLVRPLDPGPTVAEGEVGRAE